MNMAIKTSLKLIAFACAVVLVKKFCYAKTDGFELWKIKSDFSYHAEWDTPGDPLTPLFDQPFYYLAKGAQSYVFASADGNTVIKFFRIYHLTPPAWLTAINLPPFLQTLKIAKLMQKRQELDKDFQSYKIAFEELKEETGLLYVHLNKTGHLNKTLTLYDKIGIAHQVDLDSMEFLVQKKATLVYPTIDTLMKSEGDESAKEAITSLVRLLFFRCEKGIFDKDPDLNTNFGFIHRTPVQIDIGRFRWKSEESNHRDEVTRITDNFRQWLDKNYPPLSEHLLNEIKSHSL